ncbi:MAG: tRNA preQ1(34) S-adenosylmethionine ribosyltransferase-isomerase QueA [Candidatus Abyssobacteria bacterium SURF_5]|uniref:S-adenosylmethionine:tRNA ribosyltransferase-isomerase n=1 Tax=Abyssobacteria bacterium (strain SURF_5) TaxID=2093360 RepID=A0A3A4P4M0_ABYX5|nr:MAG: tRNA preQ1(34) S-adenosylmethionine ribosyltransferase-isomerase QueA [Candidatus Abyssubacteria bacterium SURF_5]
MKLSDFDYELPQELIAQHPRQTRGQSRLMVINRSDGSIRVGTFNDILTYLQPGDALVLNDTKVFPARLRARKSSTGAAIELLLLNEVKPGEWEALVRPGRRVEVGTRLSLIGARQADTVEVAADCGKTKILRFYVEDVRRLCWRIGEIPLPPYIKRRTEPADHARYQTVFAKRVGAAAAPTAGLHFTTELLKELRDRDVQLEYVTLHIGLGTFQPLEYEEVEKNMLHQEAYALTEKTASRLNEARKRKKKIVAVGTTTLRLLETVVNENCLFEPKNGFSDIFIYPGHTCRSADALVTNFHLPRSSLLLLVSAFAGRDLILRAYKRAIQERFLFYSYGDAMLIL